MKLSGKVLVAQAGGPTAVINQSLVGAVLESRKFPQITKVYGALKGVEGVIQEEFIDLTQETTHNLEMVAQTPSSALLSTRIKPDVDYCLNMFEVMQAHDIRYFFYIGGNDSSDTLQIINSAAEKSNYELRCIHIPKTIDNDLVLNDHTPGFGSAARFVGQAFTGINLDNRALGGVYIGVVMGRHAGFLTAASIIGQKYPDDGPHLVYVPERAFSIEKFLEDVNRVYKELGRCIVAVSEGICDEQGLPIIQKVKNRLETDEHGNVQLSGTGSLGDMLAGLVKKKLDIKRVRSDTFGYLQRSFIGCVSDVDQHEAREVGERAAQFAIWNNVDGSVVIRRTGHYSVNYELVRLSDIAGKTRHLEDEYIGKDGNKILDTYRHYVSPLIGTGFPVARRLKAPRAQKILGK